MALALANATIRMIWCAYAPRLTKRRHNEYWSLHTSNERTAFFLANAHGKRCEGQHCDPGKSVDYVMQNMQSLAERTASSATALNRRVCSKAWCARILHLMTYAGTGTGEDKKRVRIF